MELKLKGNLKIAQELKNSVCHVTLKISKGERKKTNNKTKPTKNKIKLCLPEISLEFL